MSLYYKQLHNNVMKYKAIIVYLLYITMVKTTINPILPRDLYKNEWQYKKQMNS